MVWSEPLGASHTGGDEGEIASVRPAGMTCGRLLRERRRAAGVTLDQLASRLGCSKSLLSQMENGRRTLSAEWAARLERALRITDGCLRRAAMWDATPAAMKQSLQERRQTDPASQRALTARLQRALSSDMPLDALRDLIEDGEANIGSPQPLAHNIPVINQVAAGYPTEFTDLDYPASVADEYIACPDVDDPDAFAARVVGDSMLPEYREGEIVVFSPALPTPNGCDCFVRLERDNETTFKRVFFEDDERVIRLQPLNEKFAARTLPREDVAALYAAAYVMRRVG